jgi:bacterioferritin
MKPWRANCLQLSLEGSRIWGHCSATEKHASQELAHALEVARQIDYRGRDSTVRAEETDYSEHSKTVLEIDMRAEQGTIKNYRQMIHQVVRAVEYALSEEL